MTLFKQYNHNNGIILLESRWIKLFKQNLSSFLGLCINTVTVMDRQCLCGDDRGSLAASVNGGNVLSTENISASTCIICAVGCGCVSVEVKWRTWQTKVSKWQYEKNKTATVPPETAPIRCLHI